MLFNKNNNNVSMAPEPEIPKFPVFPNIVSVENDATQAKVRSQSLSFMVVEVVLRGCDIVRKKVVSGRGYDPQ